MKDEYAVKKTAAIVLAGGKGSRMNSELPKQYMELCKKPVIYYALDAFEKSCVDIIVLVTGDAVIDGMDEKTFCEKNIIERYGFGKVRSIVQGGKERYNSVFNGLRALSDSKDDIELVLIHDGARPCITTELIEKCIEDARQYKACVAAVPVKDTIKVSDERGFAKLTPDRKLLWQVQTPQSFDFNLIKEAYEKMISDPKRGNITDDAMVAERYTDIPVKFTMSSYKNIKITTPEDMMTAQIFLDEKILGKF